MQTSNFSVWLIRTKTRWHLRTLMKFSSLMEIFWLLTRTRMANSTRSILQASSSISHIYRTLYRNTLGHRELWWTSNTIINSTHLKTWNPDLEVASRHLPLVIISAWMQTPPHPEPCSKAAASLDRWPRYTVRGSTRSRRVKFLGRWQLKLSHRCQNRWMQGNLNKTKSPTVMKSDSIQVT